MSNLIINSLELWLGALLGLVIVISTIIFKMGKIGRKKWLKKSFEKFSNFGGLRFVPLGLFELVVLLLALPYKFGDDPNFHLLFIKMNTFLIGFCAFICVLVLILVALSLALSIYRLITKRPIG